MKTLAGKTKAEWVVHLDDIFSISDDDEDIPINVLIYGWAGEITDEDRKLA
jgi:hypothetical protein